MVDVLRSEEDLNAEVSFKKLPKFAEKQIRTFLLDLSRSYDRQAKAVKKLQEYLLTWKPEVYDGRT